MYDTGQGMSFFSEFLFVDSKFILSASAISRFETSFGRVLRGFYIRDSTLMRIETIGEGSGGPDTWLARWPPLIQADQFVDW